MSLVKEGGVRGCSRYDILTYVTCIGCIVKVYVGVMV